MSVPPPPRTGRIVAIIIACAVFALVLALIVGGAVVFLLLRSSGGNAAAASTSPASSSPSPTRAADGTDSPAATDSAATAEQQFCWHDMNGARTSTDRAGELRGGGIAVKPATVYSEPFSNGYLPFSEDTSGIAAPVEDNWVSTIMIGKVHWQDGYDYPGNEKVSERMSDCAVNDSSLWDRRVSEKKVTSSTSEPVTIDGMSGFKHTTVVTFQKTNLTKTTGTRITCIVLTTPHGHAYYFADTAIGVQPHEKGEAETEKSLHAG